MEKELLREYIDACELIRETEEDIKRLRRKKTTVVTDRVSGSMSAFPYTATHFKVEGVEYTTSDDIKLRAEEKILEARKERAEELKLQVEEWMNTISFRMQRIIRYRLFEGMSWEQTADQMGKRATGESIRKEYEKFMKAA